MKGYSMQGAQLKSAQLIQAENRKRVFKEFREANHSHLMSNLSLFIAPDLRDVRGRLFDELMGAARDAVVNFAMIHCGHNQVQAAGLLGINRNSLRKYLKMMETK